MTLSLLCQTFPHFHTSEKCGTKDEKKKKGSCGQHWTFVLNKGAIYLVEIEAGRGLCSGSRGPFSKYLRLYVAPSNRSKGKLYSTDQFLSERKALVFKETSLLVRSFPTLPSIQSQAIAKPRIRLALPGSSFPRTEVTR